ncbi:galactoside alpha-(1,2)-fucosyltransferase 2-like isoform X2 [Ostrea edulis]|uniref:galactoside alpha-(1,2)-fucosyltransferase 2-like isoform X2 n=1 Tax=Ostrea edulis TaxID=37623 RepID=UPI0024AF09AB|nr:galactoside alpha-(1,2)-fucosyltransferase 2-like isoform X2 [Ostrea edulis]XP_056021574.1 galactoside alpha-(1,2)-fucosyltransferase 2-like isoform X2 [Ostrea edulis]XP_056021575.1 galactoside alpha-(1,2)-fucosyltransferase 2-like isoform X2 [Ostrea edulis]XP_056021576.1 galactoside alpha-(1,2)-fucosyltransferase 2-like isoform X2 [Ostrea edulis]
MVVYHIAQHIPRSTMRIHLRLGLGLLNTVRQRHVCVTLLCSIVCIIFCHLMNSSRDETPPPHIACVNFKGRLGNLMLEYAFLHIISKIKNLNPVIPENFELLKVFNIRDKTPKQIRNREKVCTRLSLHVERWGLSFDEDLFDVPTSESVRFDGYYQSWKYWSKYEQEIRDIFKFKKPIRDKAFSQFQNIMLIMNFDTRKKNNKVVSIHIRRGDYATEGHLKYGKLTPNATYYINAMNYFRRIYKNVLFIVGSNDIKWAKEALGAEENVYFSRGLSAAEDMALLSLANHTIMSVGTYGWWIGWMARGTTVYYKHIFVPGSDFSKEFKDNSTEDFVYPGWIPMDESPNGWRDV